MPLVKVKKHSQITIPHDIRRRFKIAEGDYLEIEERDSEMVLKPVRMVRVDEAYFHSKEWQAGEKAADRDIAEGNVIGPFDNVKDALKALKTRKV
jgi:antitoxin MazE